MHYSVKNMNAPFTTENKALTKLKVPNVQHEHNPLLSSVRGKPDSCFDGGMTKALSHVAPCVFSTFTTDNRTCDNRGAFLVGGSSMYIGKQQPAHNTHHAGHTLYILHLLSSPSSTEYRKRKTASKVGYKS